METIPKNVTSLLGGLYTFCDILKWCGKNVSKFYFSVGTLTKAWGIEMGDFASLPIFYLYFLETTGELWQTDFWIKRF